MLKHVYMRELLFTIVLLFTLTANAQGGRQPRFDTHNPYVHDPVMAKGEDGRYYIFSTGMGVSVISSSDMKEWKLEVPVFKIVFEPEPQEPKTGDRRRRWRNIDRNNSVMPLWALDSIRGYMGHTWAPDISYHDGLWYLYYSCSSFGKNGSGIGLAVNKTLDPNSADFKWEDKGPVIISHQHKDNYNCIDPNLVVDKKGNPWLTFGSFWDGIQIVKLAKDFKTPLSKPKTISRRIGRKLTIEEIDKVENFTIEGNDTIEAGANAVEAPFIIKAGKYYYLFVSFDYCCRGQRSTYKVVYGRSKSLIGPFVDKEGRDMARGGGTLLVGPDDTNYGIGHNAAYQFDGKWYFICHAYDKDANGAAKLFLKSFEFDADGWIEM